MKYNKHLLIVFFILTILMIIISSALFVSHSPYADTLMNFVFLSSLIFIIIAIYEVTSSKNLNTDEKIIWTIAFIFMNVIAGAVYLLIGRKRITN